MNTEKHIRLAALDLDGTTLRSDKSLSEYTIETLKNAHEHGMHIVVASGRSFASLPEQVIQFHGQNMPSPPMVRRSMKYIQENACGSVG